LRRAGRGDQLVIIQVAIPRSLTAEQERLFKELSRTLGKEIIPQRSHSLWRSLKEAVGEALGI
jgi:molecular chaperone DnaJ